MKINNIIFIAIKILVVCVMFNCFEACAESNEEEKINMETEYCTDDELAQRKSAYSLLKDASKWTIQYPSGTTDGGMLTDTITENYKTKYFSFYKNESGTEYIRFSLDASDQGKSANGSSVRTELRNLNEWTLKGNNSLSYTFYLTSTDFAKAKFTVGQFLQHCTIKDSPLCRIEIEDENITAKVTNYEPDGVTKADGKTWRYDLGSILQKQEVSIKIALAGKTMSLYRDGELKATHTFADSVSATQTNYFKAGIYYQNKNSPKIFSEVFMRELKVE